MFLRIISLIKGYVTRINRLHACVFFLLVLCLGACNIDYSKQTMSDKMDNYYQIHGEDLEELSDWCAQNIQVDTNYEISRNRTPTIFYQYLVRDSVRGGTFAPKSEITKRLKDIIVDANVKTIHKWRSNNFYIFNLGPIYRAEYQMRVLVLENGEKLDTARFSVYKPYSRESFLNDDKSSFIDKRSERFYFLIRKEEDSD